MNEREIRKKLKRLKEGQLWGDDWMTAYRWVMDELERQLDRNQRLDKQLTEIREVGKSVIEEMEAGLAMLPAKAYPGTIPTLRVTAEKGRRLAKALKNVGEDNI